MKKIYKGKNILTDKDAELIGVFIDRNFSGGHVTPHELVAAAKPKSSPVHDYFEWDNQKAAEHWRIEQARSILQCILIETEDGNEIRAFHNLKINEEEGRTYFNLETALANENLWDQIIENALKELELWKMKYQTYKELRPIRDAINKNIQKIRKS